MSTPEAPAGLLAAVEDYERALMADDVATLDRLFAPGAATLRGDADGLLVGHDAISRFRGRRGGAPARRLAETRVQVIDDANALVVAVTELARGGRGQQTQLWRRTDGGWQVRAAHVSAPPPPFDSRIWRLVGDPLVPGAPSGPLAGETVAVKDLYAVQAQRIGAGNPSWLREAAPEPAHAAVVADLLVAGADLRGIARTDELAYSLAGTNEHYGTPPNPRAPGRISGGSSSGSATAVSLGHASIGLGTDTGGSVRVPASYQGLFGLRTTHGAIDTTGLLPLARSFDAVGWLTRSAELLQRVGEVLLPATTAPTRVPAVVAVPALIALAEPAVADAVAALPSSGQSAWAPDVDAWVEAFRVVQAAEAWRQHGAWLEGRLDVLGADVRERFAAASRIDAQQEAAAREVAASARAEILDAVGDGALLLPSASSVAPPLGGDLDAARGATLRLTCLAGLAGLPAVSIPLSTADGLPCGACLIAAPGRDRDLLALAATIQEPT